MLTKISKLNKPIIFSLNRRNLILSVALILVTSLVSSGCNQNNKVDESQANSNLILGLLAGQEQGMNAGMNAIRNNFVLNGDWNTFTGNQTNSTGTLQVRFGTSWFTVSTQFNFSSSRKILEFNNTEGSLIFRQEFTGSSFPPSIERSHSKVFFIRDTTRTDSYFYCEVGFFQTLEQARAQTNTASTTNPGTTGCGGNFAWSRIDRR